MAQDLRNKYFAKNTANGTFVDLTTTFNGLRVLKVDGMLAKGQAVNIYNEQWVNSQEEDFMITTRDEYGNPIVVRENVDIDITFAVKQKYASGNTAIDVKQVHDAFISYMTNSDVWIKSAYVNNEYVHCVCLKGYKPTIAKLQRGDNSFIMGTLTLHTLDAPKAD